MASKVKGAWGAYGGPGGEFVFDYIHIVSIDKNGFTPYRAGEPLWNQIWS